MASSERVARNGVGASTEVIAILLGARVNAHLAGMGPNVTASVLLASMGQAVHWTVSATIRLLAIGLLAAATAKMDSMAPPANSVGSPKSKHFKLR